VAVFDSISSPDKNGMLEWTPGEHIEMPEGLTPQEREEILGLLSRAFDAASAGALTDALDRVAAHRAEMVTREDFQELKDAVAKLAQAQARTEQAVQQLASSVTRLEEAQARTEQRVEELAQAQARTEQAVQQLASSVTRLEEAQARTEQAVQQLARQVGGLSETVGGDIEDIAYIVLHDVLKREFGWNVGVLERCWQQWNGHMEEVNVFGQAQDPTHPESPIWIVGEAKHNVTLREVERFAQQVERARQHLTGTLFPVVFCYRARPEVQARLRELGIRLVFSYGRLV
jgi:exonuclease VII small subunit